MVSKFTKMESNPIFAETEFLDKFGTKATQKDDIELKKELTVLHELGLEEYEIEYLVYLKTKQIARKKWH